MVPLCCDEGNASIYANFNLKWYMLKKCKNLKVIGNYIYCQRNCLFIEHLIFTLAIMKHHFRISTYIRFFIEIHNTL